MPFGTNRGSTTRQPATSPKPSKAGAIRSARERDQAKRQVATLITNLTLYGEQPETTLAEAASTIKAARAKMQ